MLYGYLISNTSNAKIGPFFYFTLSVESRACLITLQSNFEIFQKGHPAVEVMLDRRIFER